MTRLMNSGTFQEAFGTKPNSTKGRSVYRFPGTGSDGQASVSAGYAAQAPSIKAPSSYATSIADLQMPTFRAQSTWAAPENLYQGVIDALSQARTMSQPTAAPEQRGGGGNWGAGTGKGLGLAAYGFKGTTGQASQRGTGKLGLQQDFSNSLDRMFADMAKQGLGAPSITDGFRSYEGQVAAKKKWEAKGKPQMAATPGRSIHGLGLAADLGLTTAQYKWMKANAARYGIVNLPSESWHWQADPAKYANRTGGGGNR